LLAFPTQKAHGTASVPWLRRLLCEWAEWRETSRLSPIFRVISVGCVLPFCPCHDGTAVWRRALRATFRNGFETLFAEEEMT